MTTIELHPSELAYVFSYSRTEAVIGWGSAPFLPAGEADGDLADWLDRGGARLAAAGRLTGTPETGLNFTDDMAQAVLALADPRIVLMGQHKAGEGVRTLTVHVRGDDAIGLTRHPDGMFEMTRYADLTAAAGACAAFAGASLTPLDRDARAETDQDTLTALRQLARAGEAAELVAGLVRLGLEEPDARSVALGMSGPAAAGVVSVLYCQANAVSDAETFSVMTNGEDHTWIMFAPAGPDGPVILERSSVAALTARIAVGVLARVVPAG